MTENVAISCSRDDREQIKTHVEGAIQTLNQIPTDEIESMLCIVTKKPSLDEDGDMSVGRVFVCVGAVDETSENIMEIIRKTAEMLEKTHG